MTTPTTSLFVTIVSTDRDLLCELSWTLTAIGYQVTTTSDFSDESPGKHGLKPGILLVDTRSHTGTDEVLASQSSHGYVYRIAIAAADAAERLLLEGADDVIRHPVNTGELLTRLRVGVRRIEFETRLARRGHRDATTGLLSRQGLLRVLNPSATPTASLPRTVVSFGIDFLLQIREQYGSHAERQLRESLARCIEQSLEAGEHGGVLSKNSMLATLCRSTEHAYEFAETIAKEFSATNKLVREVHASPTISASIATWDASIPAAEQLERCESILEQVHSFGGNYIASAADVQQRIANWRADMDAGVPFEDVVAQDIMELFPAVLTEPQVADGFSATLPSVKSHLPAIPIINDDGKLVAAMQLDERHDPLLQTPSSQLHTIQYNQPLNELFETFSTTESESLIVVDGQGHPVGYLHREGLASLVLDPINAANYRSPDDSECTTASLIVPVVPNRVAIAEPTTVA